MASTSNASSGRAHRKRTREARSGDCTSAWKRTSTSPGSARRSGMDAFSTVFYSEGFAPRAPLHGRSRCSLVRSLGLSRLRWRRAAACGNTRTGTARSAASSPPRRPCDVRGSAPGSCRRSSRSARSRKRVSSISTDATCAMCIECSWPPTQRRRVVHDAPGVTATCVGNSRLPRLNRLARNTCGPGELPPLPPEEDDGPPPRARSQRATTRAPAHRRCICHDGHARDCRGAVTFAREPPAVKDFRPIGRSGDSANAKLASRRSGGSSCPTERPERRASAPQLPGRQSHQVLPAARQRRGPRS